MDTKQRPEERRTLTASAAPSTRDSVIRLASGRLVRVKHGRDFATLVRMSPKD